MIRPCFPFFTPAILTVLGLFYGVSNLSATDVSGTINTNTTWSAAGSPYNLTGNVTVSAGVTLTIEPGVEVIANQFRDLIINGTLSAVGAAGSPVIFKGSTATAGWWAGINVANDGSATLEHCEIRDTGYFNGAGIYKHSTGGLILRNSLVTNGSAAGLRLLSGSSSVISENNHFQNNADGIRLGINASFSDTTSTFENNSFAPVAADGGTHTTNVSWELSPDYSVVISASHTVAEGATLTLMPGLVVKATQYDGFLVNGTLTAEGTAEAPIHLTSHRDDAVGGDANNDGNATAPSAGWWSGIDIQDGGSASFAHCSVSYTGYFNLAGVFMRSSGDLSIANSTLNYSSGAGLRLTSGYGSFLSENNHFEANDIGIRLGINASFSDTTSTFENNSFAPVAADGGTHTANVSWELSSDYSIVISNSHTVAEGATLTLMPGLVVKATQYDGFLVNGTLAAEGTAEAPIHLTSHRDDSVGGDANNDGEATQPAAGWWSGIDIQNHGSASFDHCRLAYSGYFNGAGIFKRSTGALSLTNNTLSDTGGAGLRLNAGSSSVLSENNQFENNADGVRLGINTSFSDTTSTFGNNSFAPVAADGGTHTTDVNWELSSDSSLVISNSHTVAEGATLTLMPGLVVKATQYDGFLINGALIAEGTMEAPIYLTSHRDDAVGGDANNDGDATGPARGWWSGIDIQNTGSASFDHVTVAYSGYFNVAGIFMRGSGDFSLMNSTIKETEGSGLRLTSDHTSFSSWNNRFENNGLGVRVALNATFADTTSAFVGNRVSQVGVDGGTLTGDVTWNVSAHSAILIQDNVTVGPGTTLTLSPGLVLKFAQYHGLTVDGTLVAEGAPGRPVVFTSSRDDTAGGDTNNDGDQTMPAAGWWAGVLVRDSGSIQLDNCELRYSGYFHSAGIRKAGTGNLSLRNCMLGEVAGSALYLEGATGEVELVRSRFENSEEGVRFKDVAQEVALVSCHLEGNSAYGVLNTNSGEVDARGNWWGDETGPLHPDSNPEGQGDPVSDGVLFDPWRQSPGTIDILSPTRPGTIVAGDTLRFLGSPLDSALAGYSWDFGDGRTSNTRNPGLVTFPNAGEYPVTYAVTNNGVPDPFPQVLDLTVVAGNGTFPDLEAVTLDVPDSVGIGQSLTVHYTVKNVGPAAVPASSWTDRIYLSRDTVLDTADTLLGSVGVSRSLAGGESYQNSLSVTIPPSGQGARNLLLSSNDDWDLVELRRLNNERSAAVNVLIPELQEGVAFEGEFSTGGTDQYFRMEAAGGENLLVDFQNIEPNLDAFIRFGQIPTRGDFDFRLNRGALAVPSAAAGSWFILVHGDALQKEGQFSLGFDAVDVAVTTVSPSLVDSAAPLDLSLAGVGFAAPLTVELIASNDAAYAADTVQVNAFDSMSASFGAGTLPADTYDVRVLKGGSEYVLSDAVEVVSGGIPDFWVDITSPTPMGYHQLATIFVEYGNRGTAPMEAPLLVVTALQNERPGALMTLDQTLLNRGFWTSAIPKGFSTSVRMMASGAKPGLLLPGESKRVPVYYAGWLKPWDFSYPPFEFKVVALTAQDKRPVPWNLLKDTLKSPDATEEAWDAVWENVTANVGTTVGDFVTRLSRNAVYLSKLGVELSDVNALLAFELIKAKGLTSALSELVSGLDLYPHQGLVDLKFLRKFPRNLYQRYRLGPLGYGWNHIWEISLREEADGTVVITHGNGATRVFQPDSRGRGYFASRGDTAALRKNGGEYTLTELSGNQLTFDGSGRLTRRSDRNTNAIDFQYEGDRLTRLTHSNGIFIDLTYNGSGLISQVEDSLGRHVGFSYDANRHLIQVTDAKDRVTAYVYDDSGDPQLKHALKQIIYPGGFVHDYGYDGFGRLASHATGLGATVFDYDQGDLISTDGEGNTATASFDHLGSLRRMVTPRGGVVSFSHDQALNNTRIRSEDGTAMSFAYDRDNGITEAVDQKGQVKTYGAAKFGKYGSATTAEGRRLEMEYDANGNLTRLVYPDGNAETFGYDATGRITEHVTAHGITETTTYNEAGLPLTKSYSDGSSRTFTYDAQNRLVTATNEEGTTTLEYDDRENLVKITYPNGLFIAYEYDGNSRLIASRDHRGMTNRYRYNAAGFLERLSNADDEMLVRYVYDAAGRLKERHFATGALTQYERNPDGQITRQTTYDDTGALVAGYAVEYDLAGQVSHYQTPEGVYHYAYDQAGNVIEEIFEPDAGPAVTTAFAYDADGELVKQTVDGVETLLTVNELGRHTAVGASTADFDAAGNIIRKTNDAGQFDYAYNAVGNLVNMETDAGDYTLHYDALGIPFQLESPDTTLNYLYDINGPPRMFGEYQANGDPLRTYQNGLVLSVIHFEGESYFPEFNPLSGDTDFVLPATVTSPKAPGPVPPSEPRLIANAIYQYADEYLLTPENFGRVMDGFVTLNQAAQRIGRDIDLAYRHPSRAAAQMLLDFVRNPHVGAASGYLGLPGPLSEINQSLGKLTNLRIVITDPPPRLVDTLDFLLSDGVGNALSVLGVIAGGVEAADGIQETWDQGRSVDWLDVVNPFGTPDGSTNKIRHGAASAAGVILGTLVAGTALAPVAAVAGVAAWISDNTGGLQEDFWIWWDGLDVTGERLRGSSMSGSTDPNQKLGVSGYGPENYVADDRRLTYRVDFENDPSATAPAQVVTIRDQLPDEVDWSTFEIVEVGFGDITIPVEAGTRFIDEVVDYAYQDSEYDFEVEVHVEVSIEEGEIFAIFYTLDPVTQLPPPVDTGFLPPEVEKDDDPESFQEGEGRGQGHLTYAVYPKAGLPTDTEIRNVATIQFDFSFDIDTNQVDPLDASKGTDPDKEALVTIDSDIPQATVETLPALSLSRFQVNWMGQSASGMRNYDVYVRVDGGGWNLWLAGTDQTRAQFSGRQDANYEFYAVGTSNVGRSDPFSPTAQAMTIAGIDDLFVTAERTEAGKLSLSWIGGSGYQYQVQSSGDLETWMDVGAVQTPGEAVEILSVVDDAYDFSSDRFYRVVILTEAP